MKFWRENKLSQEWEASDEEIIAGFHLYIATHPSNRPLSMQLANYFVDPDDGLNSTFEHSDLAEFEERCWRQIMVAAFGEEGR